MTKATTLYLTDAQVAERIGLSTEDFTDTVPTLERQGFPLKDPLFNNRRYWPAVQAFLDKRNGLASSFVRRQPAASEPAKGVEVW